LEHRAGRAEMAGGPFTPEKENRDQSPVRLLCVVPERSYRDISSIRVLSCTLVSGIVSILAAPAIYYVHAR